MTTRTLSCFFVREFFWLYLEGGLDKNRSEQVEEHLTHCGECTTLFKRLKTSKKIMEELSQTKPTAEVIEYIQKEHRFWDETFQNLGIANSISTIKWVAQLAIVGVALFMTIHLFPWLNLAQSLKNMRPSTTRMAPDKRVPPDTVAVAVPVPVVVSAASATPKPPPPFIGPLLPTPKERAAMEPASAEASIQSGYVWRGSLKVDELTEEVRDRVSKFIVDLGGKKAGQVELGWLQGKSYYYHFILPEGNYEKLLNQLNTEGIVQLNKEKHPRLIKSGYMRIIMILDEDVNQDEAH